MWRGLQAKPTTRRSVLEIVAMVLSVSWIVSIGLFFFYFPPRSTVEDDFHSLWFILILIVMLMPVAMIWLAATTSHSVRIVKEESSRLQAVIDGMSKAYTENTAGSIVHTQPKIEKKAKEISQATRKTENTLTTFASSRLEQKLRLTPVHVISNDNQTTLALGTSSEDVLSSLSNADLIRALNFPDNEKDARAISSLGLALKDRNARQLVQASQDILTLMSQDGIYMDNLNPDFACSVIWRRFARGERGIAMGALGGIRDSVSLAVTTGRMHEDTIFRDAAHHFLRRFDQTFIMFEPSATDEEISALSETRTARAFMFLGRITGAFDWALEVFLKTLPFVSGESGWMWGWACKAFHPWCHYVTNNICMMLLMLSMPLGFVANLEISLIFNWLSDWSYLSGTIVVYQVANIVAMLFGLSVADAAIRIQWAIIDCVGFLGILILLLGSVVIGHVVMVLAIDLIVFSRVAENPMIMSISLCSLMSSLTGLILAPVRKFLEILGEVTKLSALFVIDVSLASKSLKRMVIVAWL